MTAIFITAKTGSKRLPGKHFISIGGKPIMAYLVDRMEMPVFIVTGNKQENRCFERFGCYVFYGSDDNIPLRHAQAVEAIGADRVIAVDGDDILCAREAVQIVADLLDTCSAVQVEGLPFGMNAFGYRPSALKISEAMETGWKRALEFERTITINGYPDLRMSLDYPEDLEFFRAVLADLGSEYRSASVGKIVAVAEKHKDINAGRHAEYWRNFNTEVHEEQFATVSRHFPRERS